MIAGSMALGIKIALMMKKRVEQLKEIERIINYIEGEIRYKHSILKEACINASTKCGQPFSDWLEIVGDRLELSDSGEGFSEIWFESLNVLYEKSLLSKRDINEINSLGQTLGYLDIRSQEMGLKLEKENIHERLVQSDRELMNRMKISVILGTLSGIFIVIMLL